MPRIKGLDSGLIDQWVAAKKSKDFSKADKIRDELRRKGIMDPAALAAPDAGAQGKVVVRNERWRMPDADEDNETKIPTWNGPTDDWDCGSCGFTNFATRSVCKGCGKERSEREVKKDYDDDSNVAWTGRQGGRFGSALWDQSKVKGTKNAAVREDIDSGEDEEEQKNSAPTWAAPITERELRRKRIREERERAQGIYRPPDSPERKKKKRRRSRSLDPGIVPAPPTVAKGAGAMMGRAVKLQPALHHYKSYVPTADWYGEAGKQADGGGSKPMYGKNMCD